MAEMLNFPTGEKEPVEVENNEIETNGFENLRFYLLFPIRCGDFH